MLLVHGIGTGRAAWSATAGALAAEAQVIAYDRRGYGESGAPEPYTRTTVSEQAEDAALLAALGAGPRWPAAPTSARWSSSTCCCATRASSGPRCSSTPPPSREADGRPRSGARDAGDGAARRGARLAIAAWAGLRA